MIQGVGVQDCPITVQVVGNDVEVVERFTYLGTQISNYGSCEAKISRRIAITRDCVRALQRHIWRSIEQVLRPLNIGLVSAWQWDQDREWWRQTVETATLNTLLALL